MIDEVNHLCYSGLRHDYENTLRPSSKQEGQEYIEQRP